ncbi:MAG: hypothetical protein OXT69_13265 [Candidatus Poribacteria bacterium]|nr:hypothetical protein [Candidatus Poribacteria bacterium]
MNINLLFGDPWRRRGLRELFIDAFRLYGATLRQTAPAALLFLLIGAALGGLTAYALWVWVPLPFGAEHAAAGSAAALTCVLCLSPFGSAMTARIAACAWTQTRPPIGIRRLRLTGAAAFLAFPSMILVYAFPYGALALVFSFWWMFSPHAALIEGDGGRAALRRSRMLSLGEFNSAALPGAVSLSAALVALMMIQAMRPAAPPRGFNELESGDYIYRLQEGERYDPKGNYLIQGERQTPYPSETEYDPDMNAIRLPAPEPTGPAAALLWAGLPTAAAALLEPVRWWAQCLLYYQFRLRNEGISPEQIAREMEEEADEIDL